MIDRMWKDEWRGFHGEAWEHFIRSRVATQRASSPNHPDHLIRDRHLDRPSPDHQNQRSPSPMLISPIRTSSS